MDINRILEKYETHSKTWETLVNQVNEANYTYKPATDAWSISELTDHLIQVTNKCLDNALLCAENKGETNHRGFGPAIFSLMGAFPPVKLRITTIPAGMEHIYHPRAITRQQALEGLNDCLMRMQQLKDVIADADKKQRVKHWAGGWFNAKQWYHSAEMHLKHHFRQFKRLKKQFPVA